MARSALVTGGSSGIGLAIARMLGNEGYELTLVGRSPEKLEAAVGSLGREGLRADGGEADVASEEDVRAVVRDHEARYGRLDVLVNSAGVLGLGPIEAYPTGLLDELLAVNLRAPILFYRECLDLLRSSGAERGALVVNISSVSGKRGDADFGVYSATKFGVVGFTQSMRAELGGSGIASCAVCPAVVNTEMGGWAKGWMRPRDMLQPEDVAEAVRGLVGRPIGEVPPEIVLDAPGGWG